jgi:hypothetical protein
MPHFFVHSRLMLSNFCENIQTVAVLFHVDDLYSHLLSFVQIATSNCRQFSSRRLQVLAQTIHTVRYTGTI